MNLVILNGPNLNLVGTREPGIYGNRDMNGYIHLLRQSFPGIAIAYHQTNIEGELVSLIQEHGFICQGIILNAGGYTHTSVAVADAVAAIPAPVIEVHISNIHARETERKTSLLSKYCKGSITGLGLDGYELAVMYLSGLLKCSPEKA